MSAREKLRYFSLAPVIPSPARTFPSWKFATLKPNFKQTLKSHFIKKEKFFFNLKSYFFKNFYCIYKFKLLFLTFFCNSFFSAIFRKFYERSFEFDQVIKLWIGPKLVVFLIDPRDVEVILSSNVYIDKSSEYRFFKPWLGNGLLISSGNVSKAQN